MARIHTQLVILWLLSEEPQHGYRIKTILNEGSLQFWFPIEGGSIYSALSTLAKQGFVAEEAVERAGKRPERTRYRITSSGRDHLRHLLRKAWAELPAMADAVNVAMAATSELPPEEVRELRQERQEALQERLKRLEAIARSAPAPEMVDRLRAITLADLEWTRSLDDTQKKETP